MSDIVLSESATIHRSQPDVWDAITTPEHWAAWYAAGLAGVSPAWEEGATMTFVSGEKPVIRRIAPPELLEWGKGTAIRLAAIDPTTTRITYSHTVGAAFAQDPMLLAEYENMFATEAARMLHKLRRLLESQETEPAPAAPAAAAQVAEATPAPPAPEPTPDPAPARQPGASRILNSSVIVYHEASETSPRVAECFTGDRVQFGPATGNEGKTWVQVTLADGRQGYLLGSTRHFPAERAFACLPISGNTVSATFPDLCVYCAQPADTGLEVVYDESPKKATRPPGALLATLQVPYCARHARESRRNRRAVGASVLAAILLAALAALTIGITIVQRGIFGFESGEPPNEFGA